MIHLLLSLLVFFDAGADTIHKAEFSDLPEISLEDVKPTESDPYAGALDNADLRILSGAETPNRKLSREQQAALKKIQDKLFKRLDLLEDPERRAALQGTIRSITGILKKAEANPEAEKPKAAPDEPVPRALASFSGEGIPRTKGSDPASQPIYGASAGADFENSYAPETGNSSGPRPAPAKVGALTAYASVGGASEAAADRDEENRKKVLEAYKGPASLKSASAFPESLLDKAPNPVVAPQTVVEGADGDENTKKDKKLKSRKDRKLFLEEESLEAAETPSDKTGLFARVKRLFGR